MDNAWLMALGTGACHAGVALAGKKVERSLCRPAAYAMIVFAVAGTVAFATTPGWPVAWRVGLPWETLNNREQHRILKLLIERIDYDDHEETIAITFHPTGIKARANATSAQTTTISAISARFPCRIGTDHAQPALEVSEFLGMPAASPGACEQVESRVHRTHHPVGHELPHRNY